MGYTLKKMKNSPFKNLTESYVSSDFGYRSFTYKGKKHEGQHNGIDLTTGEDIVAIGDGKVTACRKSVKGYDESKASGNYVTIEHDNGIKSTYAHIKYGSVKVNKGDKVKKGDVLGKKGSTGFSTGPHLHFGISVNGKYVDPKPYLLGEVALSSNLDTSNTTSSITKIARDVINGKYGNGEERKKKLGDMYEVVQKEVNRLLSISPDKKEEPLYYVVKKGDSLSLIGKKFGVDWYKIYEKNRGIIGTNPDRIYPGQKLRIK